MNYLVFKNVHIGSRVDFDKAYGYQCVDLAKLWSRDGWGLAPHKVGHSGGAKDIFKFENAMLNNTVVRRIPNSPTGVPPAGAIIIFDSAPLNIYGHVAVVDSADVKAVTVLEQNANGHGDGVGTGAIRLHKYSYSGNGKGVGKVLGWLVPLKGPASGTSAAAVKG